MSVCKLRYILGSQLQQIRLEVFSWDYLLIFNVRENDYEKFMKDKFVKNMSQFEDVNKTNSELEN